MLTKVLLRTFVDDCRVVVAKDAEGGVLIIELEATADLVAPLQQPTPKLIFTSQQYSGTVVQRDTRLTYLRGNLHGRARIPSEREERNIL